VNGGFGAKFCAVVVAVVDDSDVEGNVVEDVEGFIVISPKYFAN